MNRMLIAFVAIIALPVAASAGVPNEEADVFLPVKPKVASAKRLPWQELQPFYWDRASPRHAPFIELPRRTPFFRIQYLPSEVMPELP